MSVALAESQGFVGTWLAGHRRVLEVGCGRGELAAWLAERGHEVTAIDRRLPPEASGGGVAWAERDFFAFAGGPFDAIVLVAVLHHLWPIDAAATRLRTLLAPDGIVVVDDFDVAAPDAATASWWFAMLDRIGRSSHAPPDDDPISRWGAEHRHEGEPPLHTATAMTTALAEAGLTALAASRGPYLYRYVDDAATLAEEQRGIAAGSLVPVGFRIVAARR